MGNIIIVEDDSVISEGLGNIIKDIDRNINTYSTAYSKEALEISEKNNIDAFFLDIQLKDYSGLKRAEQIRNIDKYKFTPIVFITAIPTREMIAFKEIHCYDYIVKPFDEKEVRGYYKNMVIRRKHEYFKKAQ